MAISGYVIEKYNSMGKAYTCRRLAEEAALRGIRLDILGIHDTLVGRDGLYNAAHSGREPLEHRQFVLHRYKWGGIKREVAGLADRSYNPLEPFERYVNKYEQVKRLRSEAFLVPEYLLGTSQTAFDDVAQRLGLPFVAKGLESSMGQEIFLIRQREDLEVLGARFGSEKEWLFEQFISESFGRDIRFYSIRGEIVACMTRQSHGDFRANVALGADVKPFQIAPEYRRAAKDIYEATGLDLLGIDLLFGKELPYLCEINVMPGLEGIEKATGVNVAGAVLDMIRRDFS